MSAPLVVAIDPGSKHTGIVARHGDQLLGWHVLNRQETCPRDIYHQSVIEAVDQVRRTADLALDVHDPITVLHAIEDLHEPSPHLGLTNLRSLMGTAELIGYLRRELTHGAMEEPLLVPPGRYGRAPLGAYPDELVTPNECKRQDWRLKPAGRSAPVSHCRSAWDLAHAARQQADRDQHARRMA